MLTNTTVSWEELERTPQWRDLTPQQKDYCRALISNGGDPRAATLTAYKCSSEKNAICLSYEIRKHPAVRAFLELHDVLTFGAPSREVQIAGVLQTIRDCPSYVRPRAQRLLAELTGFVGTSTDDPETPEADPDSKPPVSKIGDVVLQDGQKYRVTAIDENGIATDGDLLETL